MSWELLKQDLFYWIKTQPRAFKGDIVSIFMHIHLKMSFPTHDDDGETLLQ